MTGRPVYASVCRRFLTKLAAALLLFSAAAVNGQISNLPVRVMAANITSGNYQSYEGPGIRIFQGLKPDIVAIQEFQYQNSSSTSDLRTLVDTAFGTDFNFYVEPSGNIPNGIVSRWPMLAAGSWDDPLLSDRGFAWAQIDLPGSNDLYVVSLHLYASGSSGDRNTEATLVKSNILAHFPTNAWVIVGGDFNTSSRGEAAVTTFKTFLSDAPIPTDSVAGGDPDTNEPRSNPYDYLLPNFPLTNHLVPLVLPSNTFSNGLVFDSAVYSPLSDVAPVASGDSHVSGMQHMAVVKDFLLPVFGTNGTPAPVIVTQPQNRTNTVGTTAEFSVIALGAEPLNYQWRLNGTNISGANTNHHAIASVQTNDAGNYTVIVTNTAGSITSSVATLTVIIPPPNTPPNITNQPASRTNAAGSTATFSIVAGGTEPLSYQWRFNGTNLLDATNSSYSKINVQTNDAGPYTVVITNVAGAITSAPAVLTVTAPSGASGTNVVISQIYGGGGLTGASYQNDFVELFNPTASAVSLNGWTVQYANVTGSSWSQTALSGEIQPYSYYLVRLASNGANGGTLPTADASNTSVNISATQGKLALVQTTTSLSGTNPLPNAIIVDFVGYGGTASAYEGSSPVSTLSGNTNSLQRRDGGLTDTDDNGEDFSTLSPPAPRNSASPTNPPLAGPPAMEPTLTTPQLVAGQLMFQLTGTAASNYIVQGSTDLAGNNWQPLQTNAAPFWFTNPTAESQQFFRGAVAQ
jgi:endonuclease/exonuclease/phosphatase family metal-dependent hydrolase